MIFKDRFFTLLKILVVFTILASCSNLKYLNPYEGYQGKPIMVESINYDVAYKDGIEVENRSASSISYFDNKGRKIKEQDYNSDGTLSWGEWSYKYDKKGNLVQITLYNLDSTIMVNRRIEYNKYGLPTKVSTLDSETLKFYDRKNRSVTSYTNNSFNNLKSVLRYNSKWKEIEAIEFDDSDNPKSRIEFYYDKKGNEILSKWYNAKDQLYIIYKQEFNSKNHRTKIEKYTIIQGEPQLENVKKIEYNYDNIGNCIQQKYMENDKTTWITRYKITYY